MSWIGWLNMIVVQWFGMRIVYDGSQRVCGVLGPVVPLTGWWSEYIPRRPKVFRWK